MSYKRLGDFIQQVNIRNTALQVNTLLGVSISKKLIPSIANTIGTDMSSYKIIKKGQFAYGTVTSRNGEKISIALLDEYEQAIVSQIYIVFEVVDTQKLLPEYLMMWFSRPEFDRYARFHSHGSTRETFDWEDMCDVLLPIPSIEKQREIVAQYQSIAAKIKTNEALCEKLEATAQTLYKHWFVDFEFPNENGKPYFSSGGEMVYHEELQKEIPKGWEVKSLGEIAEVKYGKDYKHLEDGNIPLYGSGGIMKYVNNAIYKNPSVLIPRKGTLNNVIYVKTSFWSVDTMFYTISRVNNILIYIFYLLSRLDLNLLNVGSAVPSMTTEYLNNMQVLLPSKNILEKYDLIANKLYDYQLLLKTQTHSLKKLQSLLLVKMGESL